ncbi:metal-dependent protein hydrolase [Guyanagaster necrorhizus]|uniref:Metal-dependent protein hydrolase n=1 Tax=Guyanagaster necrorhizus TaxID=856835 RepID=A0A9P7W381_9AGAR|nr:metal-dependent protein hydrolase [Guyanagaster necrorhizus MCA 3950]KAG7450491.1 metal-dependent protein hydrolase [Guyanagaster necrorhizus MCA 3950]
MNTSCLRSRFHSFFSLRSLTRSMSDLSPLQKKQKMDHQKIIGTHNGTFHCDEALAVFLLRQTTAYQGAELKRTRDPAILDSCDIVVDVGAIYDEAKQRFDHHQRGFTQVFGHGFTTKLSSAGLVFKHFGKEVISNRTQVSLDDPKVQTLWLKMYEEFIEAIDGGDNGIPRYPEDIKPAYKSGGTSLPSRVAALNPSWNQPVDSQGMDDRFAIASSLTGEEFFAKLDFYANAWLPARDILVDAVANSKKVADSTGKILLLEQFLPWKSHLFELESESQTEGQTIYVVYPDEMAKAWRIQAVPIAQESFESRKALPEQWRGLRDDELTKVSGIQGGIFVHASGFIGGNQTKEGALKLAQFALTL